MKVVECYYKNTWPREENAISIKKIFISLYSSFSLINIVQFTLIAY